MHYRIELLARGLAVSGLGRLLRRVRTWQGVLTLGYHRIGEGRDSPFDRGLWSATPDVFDAQMHFLKKYFEVIGPADLRDVLDKARGRYVLVTFDDGYRDNYEWAFPILRAHGVTATFFIATGFLDRPRVPWWDEIAWMVRTSPRRGVPAGPWLPANVRFDEPGREEAVQALLRQYKALPGEATYAYLNYLAEATASGRCPSEAARNTWMTWDMVRELRAAGMAVGGHTVEHPVLARLARARQAEEIAGCKRRLEAELGGPMTCFSYPVGGPGAFNEDTRACLEENGVELAFSYYRGFRRFDDWDPYDIRRIPVETDTSLDRFRGALTLPQVIA